MKHHRLGLLAAAVALCLAAPVYAHDDHAHDHDGQDHSHDHDDDFGDGYREIVEAGDLVISGPFTRATNPGAPVGGGYFGVTNAGDTDDRLIAVESDVSERVEIHEMSHVDDVMTMRELSEGLPIPAGETVVLAPGGYHLMFMNLDTAFVEGETIDAVLVFENAGRVDVTLAVGPAGAREANGHENDHSH